MVISRVGYLAGMTMLVVETIKGKPKTNLLSVLAVMVIAKLVASWYVKE